MISDADFTDVQNRMHDVENAFAALVTVLGAPDVEAFCDRVETIIRRQVSSTARADGAVRLLPSRKWFPAQRKRPT